MKIKQKKKINLNQWGNVLDVIGHWAASPAGMWIKQNHSVQLEEKKEMSSYLISFVELCRMYKWKSNTFSRCYEFNIKTILKNN